MAKKAVGGVMGVTFVSMTGATRKLMVKRGATVADVLQEAGYGDSDISEVRLNSRPCTEGTKVPLNSHVVLLAALSGGSK